jgi:hypothetical protein
MNYSIKKLSLKKSGSILLIALPILVFLFNIINTWSAKIAYGTPDLRNRVIGSRILKHKEKTSPYFYKWNKADGDQFLDMYDSPELPMNRNTVTPFTIQLLTPVCSLNYTSLSKSWYIAEAASLLIISLLMLSLAPGIENKIILLGVTLVEVGLSQNWLLHNLSGQVYIFFPLLLTLLFFLSKKVSVLNNWLSAIILSSLILMRPPAALFILPFILQSKWGILKNTFLLILTYFVILFIRNDLWIWQDYFQAMNLWSKELFNQHVTKTYLETFQTTSVEGSHILSQSPKLNLLEDSSVQSFFYRFLHIQLSSFQLLTMMVSCFAIIFLFYFKKIKQADLSDLFLLTFLFYFVAELCIPAIRNSYNAVQWIFPLSLFYLNRKQNVTVNLLLLTAAIFTLGWLKFLPFDLFIAELLFAIASIVYLTSNNPKNA